MHYSLVNSHGLAYHSPQAASRHPHTSSDSHVSWNRSDATGPFRLRAELSPLNFEGTLFGLMKASLEFCVVGAFGRIISIIRVPLANAVYTPRMQSQVVGTKTRPSYKYKIIFSMSGEERLISRPASRRPDVQRSPDGWKDCQWRGAALPPQTAARRPSCVAGETQQGSAL